MSEAPKLTRHQDQLLKVMRPMVQKFCLGYLESGNATQSYVDAGYAVKGAAQSASALLRTPKVEAFMDAMREIEVTSAIITREEVMKLLSQIAKGAADRAVIRPSIAALRVQLRATEQLSQMMGWLLAEKPKDKDEDDAAGMGSAVLSDAEVAAELKRRGLPPQILN